MLRFVFRFSDFGTRYTSNSVNRAFFAYPIEWTVSDGRVSFRRDVVHASVVCPFEDVSKPGKQDIWRMSKLQRAQIMHIFLTEFALLLV